MFYSLPFSPFFFQSKFLLLETNFTSFKTRKFGLAIAKKICKLNGKKYR